jgi:phenylacetate-CoA ligase
LDFECCHVETQPVAGSEYSKLIFTGWGNLAMPFIRYDGGDYGKQSSTPCNCGRQSLRFESINGRMEDFIVTPDGRKLIGMNQVLEYAPNAKEIQIYQKTTDSIEFRFVATDQFGERDMKGLIREFERRGGTGMSISFKKVDSLEKSRSGKLKAVISELTDK